MTDQTPPNNQPNDNSGREKVEKLAGQAYDAASDAAKHASELAGKAKAFGQEKLSKVDMDALKKGKFDTVPKPLLIGVPLIVVLILVLVFSGGGGGGTPHEKAIQKYYKALQSGNVQTVIDNTRGFEDMYERASYHVEESLKRFKSRDGIRKVNTKCGEPREMLTNVLLTTCEVTLSMRDGTELHQGYMRVSRIDGEWKVVF